MGVKVITAKTALTYLMIGERYQLKDVVSNTDKKYRYIWLTEEARLGLLKLSKIGMTHKSGVIKQRIRGISEFIEKDLSWRQVEDSRPEYVDRLDDLFLTQVAKENINNWYTGDPRLPYKFYLTDECLDRLSMKAVELGILIRYSNSQRLSQTILEAIGVGWISTKSKQDSK